jgi:uncharacterized Zn finger protein
MITVDTRCEYCGEPRSIDLLKHLTRAKEINSMYDLKCPKCGQIGKPEFSCRLRLVY